MEGSQVMAAAEAAVADAAAAQGEDAGGGGGRRRRRMRRRQQDGPTAAVRRADRPPRNGGGIEGGGGGRIDLTSAAVSDVPAMFESMAEIHDKALVAGAVSLREATESRLKMLSEVIGDLEKDDLGTEGEDSRQQAVVDRGKRQIVSIIRHEVRAALPAVETLDDALALGEATGRMIKRIDEALYREMGVMDTFAEKYVGRIESILDGAADDYSVLLAIIMARDSTAKAAEHALGDIGRIEKLGRSAEQLRARAAELESGLARLRMRGKEIAGEIESVKSSPEHVNLERLRGELDAVRGRRAAARRAASDRFTRISRPLSRYEHVSAMDKEGTALLRAVMDDPFEAVASAGAAAVSEVLGAVRKAVEAGSVSVKDRAKAARMLDEESGRLGSYGEAAARMSREEDDIGAQIAGAGAGRLGDLESDLAKNNAEADDLEGKARRARSEADEADGLVPGILARVESSLSEATGVEYTVRLDKDA